jgi:hypothetical protein
MSVRNLQNKSAYIKGYAAPRASSLRCALEQEQKDCNVDLVIKKNIPAGRVFIAFKLLGKPQTFGGTQQSFPKRKIMREIDRSWKSKMKNISG